MKKVILLHFVIAMLCCAPVLASQSAFNVLDNSLILNCLRLKQDGQIGNECYDVRLTLNNAGLFEIQSISSPVASNYENSDPIFNVNTSQVDVPNVLVGLDVYSVNLSYNAGNSSLSLNSATYLRTESSGTETIGSCDLDLSALGFGACISYAENADANRAEQACTSLGGIWRANSACPSNYLSSCSKTDSINNISYVENFYDRGIVETYNNMVSIGQSAGVPYTGPTPDEMLFEACVDDGGIPLDQ